jgi:phytoene dehydrogenase-like protein
VTGIRESLGQVGLPAPVSELAKRDWDAIVVGGGHNGLTAAAYLAKAGRSVLVCERRERLGGACTLERPFADEGFVVSPCAYVVGLLDERVVSELGLVSRGYQVFNADPNLWCPFPDGTSYAQFLDDDRTRQHMRANGFAESEIEASFAYEEMFDRLRRALRKGPRDSWEGPSPSRPELEEMLGGDEELISVLFEESIAETLDRYFADERMKHALFGQGIIGAWAGPRTAGTASVKLMHYQGEVNGEGGVWGYVKGGMGQISFLIAEAAAEAGATLAAGVPVARIRPGEGVELESGDVLRSPTVICNADPKRALALLDGADVDEGFRRRLGEWDVRSPVVKVNAALSRLPSWAAAGEVQAERAMITVTRGPEAAGAAFEACERGEPAIGFCELYFQTAYDPSTAPAGRHTMSCFCQYAPYELSEGDWESRRDEIGSMVLDEIAAYAPDVHDCVAEMDVLGPPEIESRIGLTGGNIFQGSVLPDQMWDRRLSPRTPVEGLYLCGAATHPAGSVIGLNGRNAAMSVLSESSLAGT